MFVIGVFEGLQGPPVNVGLIVPTGVIPTMPEPPVD